MVVVEPAPRGNTAVIVMHHPLQALRIPEYQGSHLFWIVKGYIQLLLHTERWLA